MKKEIKRKKLTLSVSGGTNKPKKNIDVGMYVWSQKLNHGLLGISIALVQLDLVFYYLHLNSVETSPNKHNKRAIAFNKKLGYIKINEDSKFVYIRMDKNRYELLKKNLIDTLRNVIFWK